MAGKAAGVMAPCNIGYRCESEPEDYWPGSDGFPDILPAIFRSIIGMAVPDRSITAGDADCASPACRYRGRLTLSMARAGGL